MESPFELRSWLDTLDSRSLETVLRHNALALAGAPLRDLDELASRLAHPSMVSNVVLRAPAPVLQVVEAASALGVGATTESLAELLDPAGLDATDHRAQIDDWLHVTAEYALAWRQGDRIRLNPGLDQVLICPLTLSRPARAILQEMTVAMLQEILRGWGLRAAGHKDELVEQVLGTLGDPAMVRRIAGEAPNNVLTALTKHVNGRLEHAATVAAGRGVPEQNFSYDPERLRAREWTQAAGLAFVSSDWGYSYEAEIPSEVYLALAPSQFRVDFTPQAPAVSTVPAAGKHAERAAGGALAEFVGTAMAVLEAISREGLKANKSGGVGMRELTRFSKQLGTEPATIRLILYLAVHLDLLTQIDARVTTSDLFEPWRRLSPAHRASDLLQKWLILSTAATLDRDESGKYIPALSGQEASAQMPLGLVLIQLLESFERQGVVSSQDLFALMRWYHPMAAPDWPTFEHIWAEAHQLGLVVDGAPSRFALLLAQDNPQAAADALNGLLPEQSTQVMFGSDLTIVVPGSPDPVAVDILDAVARREGHGVAGTWRVSEASVRAALDAGYVVEDLIGALAELAGQDLPQALEYLLHDVGRKHGHLHVRGAGTVITCAEEDLLAEVVATKSLHALELSLVAPTVAASPHPPGKVLAGLRTGGYLPVEVDDGGNRLVQLRHLPQRASGNAGDPPSAQSPENESDTTAALMPMRNREAERPDDAAVRLFEGLEPDLDEGLEPELESFIDSLANALSAAEVHELADAIATGRPVHLQYRSGSGGVSMRVVSDLSIQGPYLVGYCHNKMAERQFRLDRIMRIAPA